MLACGVLLEPYLSCNCIIGVKIDNCRIGCRLENIRSYKYINIHSFQGLS